MRNLRQFILDLGRWGVASAGAALVALAFAVYEHLSGRTASAFLFTTATVFLFCCGAYAAWNKKRLELEALDELRSSPKLYLRYEGQFDTDINNSGFFLQVEGEKKAFDVVVSSPPTVGQKHKRIAMQWEAPKCPIGCDAVPLRAFCVQYQQDAPHRLGGITGRQIHKFFEEKRDFPNELEVTLIYKDVDGKLCPSRKFKVTSERDSIGNFAIGCTPIENQVASGNPHA